MRNKLILILLPLALFIACGPEKNTENIEKKDSAVAKDTTAKKVFQDPMAAPTPDYSGDHIVKYNSGITQIRGFFRFGKRHGKWASFHPSGDLWSETEYDNGVRNGKISVWFPNGKLEYEGQFKNDVRAGVWKFYNETGELVKEEKN